MRAGVFVLFCGVLQLCKVTEAAVDLGGHEPPRVALAPPLVIDHCPQSVPVSLIVFSLLREKVGHCFGSGGQKSLSV